MAAQKLNEKRAAMFASAPPALLKDYRVLLRKAIYYTDIGQFDQAMAILRSTKFHPWEGWSGCAELYVRVLHARAQQLMQRKQFEPAIEDLSAGDAMAGKPGQR